MRRRILLISAILLLTFFTLSCSKEDNPQKAAENFIRILKKGENYQKAWQCLTPEAQQRCKDGELTGFSAFKKQVEKLSKNSKKRAELKSTRVVQTEIKNNRAIVTIRFRKNGDRTRIRTRDIYLKKVGNKWKIDLGAKI